MKTGWVCCQLGAREHYTIARALHRMGSLQRLITDIWAEPSSLWYRAPSAALRSRYHAELAEARVSSMNWLALAHEASSRGWCRGWDRTLARNRWFAREAARTLGSVICRGSPGIVFSYSYTAHEVFQVARQAGWKTVLGQIDAGPMDERLIENVHRHLRDYSSYWSPAPSLYWETWREECNLADEIVVNSAWSRHALVQAGIPAEKLRVVPLAYEPPQKPQSEKTYPTEFTAKRALRVLFLGQVGIRKGVSLICDSIPLLAGEPVEFRIVGPIQMFIPKYLRDHPGVCFTGPVPRGEVERYYQWADVFLFPTFSDGFGLTQLEAQTWKVPVIASRCCGDVVRDGHNGWLLDELTAEAIASTIRKLLRAPHELKRMSAASGIEKRFTLSALAKNLSSVSGAAIQQRA